MENSNCITKDFGKNSKGDKATLYTFKNKNGMTMTVSDFGATLQSVLVPDKANKLRDVVLGYDKAIDYEGPGGTFFGSIVGRSANRIGNAEDPFADALTHYNPNDCEHPNHAGDLPPLFDNSGYSFQTVLTNRFTVKEIIGKTIIIHAMPDDFKTQPSGDSGMKIACGKIRTLDFPQPRAF